MNIVGTWKGEVPIPARNLSDEEPRLEGEEKELFLVSMRKMLHWKPEDKKCIRDILEDEWLLADLIESGQVVRECQDLSRLYIDTAIYRSIVKSRLLLGNHRNCMCPTHCFVVCVG